MTLLPLNRPTAHTSASVGILGGFFLNENELRWMRNSYQERVEYREDLTEDFSWGIQDKRKTGDGAGRVGKVEKMDMWNRE